jgi:hypothetical protein
VYIFIPSKLYVFYVHELGSIIFIPFFMRIHGNHALDQELAAYIRITISYLCLKVHLDLSEKSDFFSRTLFIDYRNKNMFHKRKSSLRVLM